MAMSPDLRWEEIAIRLGLTILVGILFGYDRSAHGKAAGMRTTVLVCLAASVAMIEVNVLLPTSGRTSNSFVMNDLMRLPLGILTGIGFIGGGAILRRGNIVVGVTTAAILWLVTVIGLCIGGGQLGLGLAATALGLVALRVLRWVEGSLQQEVYSQLKLQLDVNRISVDDVRGMLGRVGLSIIETSLLMIGPGREQTVVFELRAIRRPGSSQTPAFIQSLASEVGVLSLRWRELQ